MSSSLVRHVHVPESLHVLADSDDAGQPVVRKEPKKIRCRHHCCRDAAGLSAESVRGGKPSLLALFM